MELILADKKEQILEIEGMSKAIWNEHYTPIIGAGQVDYMLKKFLSADKIEEQIKNKGFSYYFVSSSTQIIGFLAYYINDGLFLSKLYFLKEHRGKGYSKQVIKMLTDICKQEGQNRIWLQVDRKNINSINAYYALGFKKIYEKATDIGGGFLMDDYFLELKC